MRDRNNLSLTDPRRMGKTVWLELFCQDPGEGFEAVSIDFEGVDTAETFLLRTVSALRSHRGVPGQALAKLKALFENIEVAGGPVSVKTGVSTRSPTDLLDETIRSVERHIADDVLLVIAMDEVPLAIGNIARKEGAAAANQLLQTLRALRQSAGSLRWIVCGSVGFHHVLRQCEATEGAVNDLVNLPLGPLEHGEARELAQRLFLGIERDADGAAIAAMVEHSGGIPFLIHALAHRLDDAGPGPVSSGDVTAAFADFVDDRDESRAVTHLLTRLRPLYGDEAPQAEALLDRVALERSVPSAALRTDARLLNHLVDDHYLIERERTVSWRYDVLRRIWIHRRRLG